MKSANSAVMYVARLVAATLGFGAAISFMRAMSLTFNFYINRFIGNRFSFGWEASAILLVLCLGAFAFSIWFTKGSSAYPLRRIDYSFLLAVCGAGFTSCVLRAWQPLRWGVVRPWGGVWDSQSFYLFFLPMTAYIFALFAFGELIARLRDRTLVSTLYWVDFFKVYSIWQPVGFFAILILAAQMALLVMNIHFPVILAITLSSIGALTYCASHMINLAAEYDIASAEKISAERFKSELITNVSHDIKTPLTSIINYVNFLTTENLEGQAAEYVDVLVRKSARLKALIDDLMEASKASTGNMRVELQEINLAEMVGQISGEFEDVFEEKDLTLVIRQGGPSSMPVLIDADSRHLYRALENLFSNASKYALGGTRVFAEITPLLREGMACFTLQNTSALPIEMTDGELTAQFIRGDKARQTEGSGLGLYIAKSLVELMGGRLLIHVIGDLFRVEVLLWLSGG